MTRPRRSPLALPTTDLRAASSPMGGTSREGSTNSLMSRPMAKTPPSRTACRRNGVSCAIDKSSIRAPVQGSIPAAHGQSRGGKVLQHRGAEKSTQTGNHRPVLFSNEREGDSERYRSLEVRAAPQEELPRPYHHIFLRLNIQSTDFLLRHSRRLFD